MSDKADGASKAAWVSIAVAVLGLFGTSVVALIQWRADAALEQTRLDAQLKLAEQRFRSELILRALKPESERDRRDLLTFIHRAGLVEGLDEVIDSYSKDAGGFVPRAGVSFTEVSSLLEQRGLTPDAFPSNPPQQSTPLPILGVATPARRLMAVAVTPDGRKPTVDQRVAEAVRLALEGAPADQQRARQLLAEAGYPLGFTLDLPLTTYQRYGGSREEAAASARALEAIGIRLDLKG